MNTTAEDIEDLKRLKARYFRCLDTKDWPGLRSVFTDELVADSTEAGGQVITGADAFIAFLQEVLADAVTVHQGHMPEIELTSPTSATGIWALHDIVIWPNGLRLDGHGHYHETYRKTDAGWRIATSRLTRLHSDFHPPADA
ncbi:MAG: nuclear transport factor 2 family protein [Acidimicrobiales bacterium]|nr:nuclear transport factor 2 family protein [Acidimicrobiales bacterium]